MFSYGPNWHDGVLAMAMHESANVCISHYSHEI